MIEPVFIFLSTLSISPWLAQKSQIYTWDGKMPLRWRKLENFKLELPRDTLLSVEIVQELKGEVRGGIGKMKCYTDEIWKPVL